MLSICYLHILAQAMTPIELEEYSGSAMRGAFVESLLNRFACPGVTRNCEICTQTELCPVAELLQTPQLPNQTSQVLHGGEAPRPYLFSSIKRESENVGQHKSDQGIPAKLRSVPSLVRFEPGEILSFDVLLLGTKKDLFPAVFRGIQETEKCGLGRPLRSLRGERGRWQIQEVQAVHPWQHLSQYLWKRGEITMFSPTLVITQNDVQARANVLHENRVTLQLLSPLRLQQERQALKRPAFAPLIQRLAYRFAQLTRFYGDFEMGSLTREWYEQKKQEAQAVHLVVDHTHLVKAQSYSSRSKCFIPLDGLVGEVTFEGQIGPLRELLAWGEMIRVGRNITKGAGQYALSLDEDKAPFLCGEVT